MAAIVDLLGETLTSKAGPVQTTQTSVVTGVVGLYFSAHWCPPCRMFTPELVDFYEKFRATDEGKKLSVVFVSSDKTVDEFDGYYKEMPWLALPFDDRDRKAKLSKKFKVQGIPTLVLLNGASGEVITRRAREEVKADSEGKNFPWATVPLPDMMGGQVLKGAGTVDLAEARQGCHLGIYISAHWCPPCRQFTPKLVDFYNKLNANGKKLEVLFVSADRTAESFSEYFETMPWLSFLYDDERRDKVPPLLNVGGIPALMILDENCKVIAREGRGLVEKDPEGVDFPWPPKPVDSLNDLTATALNENPCVIFFTGGEEDLVTKAKELMRSVAVADLEKHPDEPIAFLYEDAESDEYAESLHGFAKIDDRIPLLCLLDIPEQKKYVVPAVGDEITTEVLQSLVNEYRKGTLTLNALR